MLLPLSLSGLKPSCKLAHTLWMLLDHKGINEGAARFVLVQKQPPRVRRCIDLAPCVTLKIALLVLDSLLKVTTTGTQALNKEIEIQALLATLATSLRHDTSSPRM